MTKAMIKELLSERNLPPLGSRSEMLDILLKEEYGYLPAAPEKLSWTPRNLNDPCFCAGKATLNILDMTVTVNGTDFTWPVYVVIPTAPGPHPFFIHINFRDNVPDQYMPTEELVDRGFAVLSFCYNDVTRDNNDFTDGLAGILYPDGKRGLTDGGKIAIWAWAAQRVMDYAQTVEKLDKKVAVVCGHSRLGKTALLAGVTDERFTYVFSNDSGCSGAAISRGKVGETVAAITQRFPYWFCEKYASYANSEDTMPFDQHYLTALVAPRKLYVASASLDEWADPNSEYLSCFAASQAYEQLGLIGFVAADRLPAVGDCFHEGNIGYHMRPGMHYLGREDWNHLIDFIQKHEG
ncbi:MAG: hypothetical protein IJ315_06730 [Firmicutes bacterium]|nr:hypothetical protein [Bacillota bacterium]